MDLVVVCLAALGALFSDVSELELQKSLAGEVPTRIESFTNAQGKAVGRGWGAIVIERPLSAVWVTLARYEDRAEYVPRLKSVTVLERQPGRVRLRQEIDASVTTARYTAWFRLDETEHKISWSLDKDAADNTVRAVEGDYRLAELPNGRTLVVYRTYVDTGLKIPRFIQSYMQERSIPELLRAIKRRVESGGTWKKR
jgi:hypothetical protein